MLNEKKIIELILITVKISHKSPQEEFKRVFTDFSQPVKNDIFSRSRKTRPS